MSLQGLFESVGNADHALYIADLGGSVSQQLPKFFVHNSLTATLASIKRLDIELHLICVVGGANIFKATMEYLVELVESVKGEIKITVALNGMHPCSPSQRQVLKDYIQQNNLPLVPFDLSDDKTERIMRSIEGILHDGQGLSQVSSFNVGYYLEAISDLKL